MFFGKILHTLLKNNDLKKGGKIRKIPYPYKASLAISNDIEYTRFDFFEALMSFLNSDKKTPFGYGLNLDITSSVFFYSSNSLSYFNGLSVKSGISNYASRIVEYLKSGWIDTNHAYGDFNRIGGFTRQHAERVVNDVILKHNVNIPCFTNHGDTFNVQNVGRDADYHKGDDPNHQAYHSDLFKLTGTNYIWTDSKLIAISKNRFGRMIYVLRNPYIYKKLDNPLDKDVLKSGQEVYVFYRYRSTGKIAPNLSSLKYQLEMLDLNEMYQRNRIVIIYQHLGVLYKTDRCFSATIESVKSRPELFLSPFYLLAREYHEGRLWVVGLASLLRYLDMLLNIEVIEKEENVFEIISKKEISNLDFFQGLTIYINNPKKPAIVSYRGKKLEIIYNGPDETGRYSVSVPFVKKEMIW